MGPYKRQIVQRLGQGMKTLDISRKRKRDHHTVKRFVADSEHRRVNSRQIHRLKKAAAKMPL